MIENETIKAIRSVDSFHKKCILLFDDIVSVIKEKTLTDEVVHIGHEGSYGVWNVNESEHLRQYIFKHNDIIRFVCMFVKIRENKLRAYLTGFQKICHELEIDPVYPLIIVFGLFQPRDNDRFLQELNLRRNWIDNTVMLGMPDNIVQGTTRSTPYEFDKLLWIETPLGTDSWYCEKSIFKIMELLEVKNSKGVESISENLLNIDPVKEIAAQPNAPADLRGSASLHPANR
jgi:hypothetical protein